MQSADTAAITSGSPDRALSPVPGTCPSCKETLTVSVDIRMASSAGIRSLRTYCQDHWDEHAAIVMLRKEKLDVGVDDWMHHPLRAFCSACNRRLFVVEERRRACSRSEDPHRTRTWNDPGDVELPLPNIAPWRPRASGDSEPSQRPPWYPALVLCLPSPQQALAPIKERSQSLSPTPERRCTERRGSLPPAVQSGPRRLLPCIPVPVSPPPQRAPSGLLDDADSFIFNPLPESGDSDSSSPESAAMLCKKRSLCRKSASPRCSPHCQPGTSRRSSTPSPSLRGKPSYRGSSDSACSQPRHMRPRSVTRWSPTPTERHARPSAPPMQVLPRSPSSPGLPVSLILRQPPAPQAPAPPSPTLRPALSENSVVEYRRRRGNRFLEMAFCARRFMCHLFDSKRK